MAALLTAEASNTSKIVKYINECRDMGIEIQPPDINSSDWNFTPASDTEIRFGLGAIKNVGRGAVESIIAGRKTEGRFRSLFHFCENVDWTHINKRMLESAIKAGALDSLGGHRSQLMAALDRAMDTGQKAFRDRASGQNALFAMIETEPNVEDEALPDVPEWTEKDRLRGEKEMLGFYVTGHPLNAFRDKMLEVATADTQTVEKLEQNANVAICGILSAIARKRNREGRPWAAATLEDLNGKVDLLVFANQYEGLSNQLEEDLPVLVRGSVRQEEDAAPKVAVNEIVPLDLVRVPLPAQISITVRLDNGHGSANGDTAAKLRDLFKSKPGETDVRLRLLFRPRMPSSASPEARNSSRCR
jgi:DNA polymerase-3 subunit alpha